MLYFWLFLLVPKDLVVADSMESFGIGVELNVAMVLSWLPLISDYTCNVNKPVKGSVISVLSYSLGSMIMFSIGLLASIVFQESDISNIIIKMGLGGMGLFIVIFSTVTTTYLDTFSVGICAESINKNWGVKKVATITCIVGTLIAVLVPSNKFEEFLYFIGSIFAPLFAVLFTDYFVLHKKENDRKFDVENIGMWIIGFAIYRVLMNYNTVIGNTLPTILIVMTLKFICNRVKCSIERK